MHEVLSIRVFARVADNTVVTCASRAIKEYCKSSSGVLAILVLVLARSANVQTKTVENNKYWKNPSVINTAIENGDFVVVAS